MPAAANIHPLLFEPILKEKVWGGRRLERLGKRLPVRADVGESWEMVDLASTSASGGGGEAAHSVIAAGALRGRTISDAIREWGGALMGGAALTERGAFPLLVKFLDARENLSVQVHPSAGYAASHPGAHLKTESWFIIDAEPGAVIYKGLKPGVTPEVFRRHLNSAAVVDDLVAIAAIPGDCHNLPSGTIHALGAGVLVAEVQTPSDTTFRIYDWGRAGREIHVEQAMQCIDFSAQAPHYGVRFDALGRRRLVTTEFFTVDQVNAEAGEICTIPTQGSPVVCMGIAGAARLSAAEESPGFEPLILSTGATMLLPAALGVCRIEASPSGATWLQVRLPAPR